MLKNETLRKTLYSSFFLVVSESLFYKISPQLYSIFSFLPLIFIGLIIEIQFFVLSTFLSAIFLILLSSIGGILDLTIIQSSGFIFSYVFFSLMVITFFFCYDSKRLAEQAIGEKLAYFNLICCLFLATFLIFFFSKINSEQVINYITQTLTNLFKNNDVYNENEIRELVKIIVKVLPAINFFIILITFFFNFFLSHVLIQKFKFSPIRFFDFKNLNTPKWYLIIFLTSILFCIFFDNNPKSYAQNITLLLSFIYFFHGFLFFLEYFKKLKLNNFIKILIIFLLFLFLGYLLILFIFFIGFYRNIKFLLNKKN